MNISYEDVQSTFAPNFVIVNISFPRRIDVFDLPKDFQYYSEFDVYIKIFVIMLLVAICLCTILYFYFRSVRIARENYLFFVTYPYGFYVVDHRVYYRPGYIQGLNAPSEELIFEFYDLAEAGYFEGNLQNAAAEAFEIYRMPSLERVSIDEESFDDKRVVNNLSNEIIHDLLEYNDNIITLKQQVAEQRARNVEASKIEYKHSTSNKKWKNRRKKCKIGPKKKLDKLVSYAASPHLMFWFFFTIVFCWNYFWNMWFFDRGVRVGQQYRDPVIWNQIQDVRARLQALGEPTEIPRLRRPWILERIFGPDNIENPPVRNWLVRKLFGSFALLRLFFIYVVCWLLMWLLGEREGRGHADRHWFWVWVDFRTRFQRLVARLENPNFPRPDLVGEQVAFRNRRHALIGDDIYALCVAPILEEYLKSISVIFFIVLLGVEINNTKDTPLYSFWPIAFRIMGHSLFMFLPLYLCVILHFLYNLLIFLIAEKYFYGALLTEENYKKVDFVLALTDVWRALDMFDYAKSFYRLYRSAELSYLSTIDEATNKIGSFFVNIETVVRDYIYPFVQESNDDFWSSFFALITRTDKSTVFQSDLYQRALKVRGYIFMSCCYILSVAGQYAPPSFSEYLTISSFTSLCASVNDTNDLFMFLRTLYEKTSELFYTNPSDRSFASLFRGGELSTHLSYTMELLNNIHDYDYLISRYRKETPVEAVFACNDECILLWKKTEDMIVKLPLTHPARTILMDRSRDLKAARDILNKHGGRIPRKEPVCVYVWGPPGVMKTDFCTYITGAFLHVLEVEEPYSPHHIYYAPRGAVKHIDAYYRQAVFMMCEAFQTDPKCMDVFDDAGLVVKTTGTEPVMLPSAALGDKGNVWYFSLINMLNSNKSNPDLYPLTTPGAFWRRIKFRFKINLRPIISGVSMPLVDGEYQFLPGTPVPKNPDEIWIITWEKITVTNGLLEVEELAKGSFSFIMSKVLPELYKMNQIANGRSCDAATRPTWVLGECGAPHIPDQECPVCANGIAPLNSDLVDVLRPKYVLTTKKSEKKSLRKKAIVNEYEPFSVPIEEESFQAVGLFFVVLSSLINLIIWIFMGSGVYRTLPEIVNYRLLGERYYVELTRMWDQTTRVVSEKYDLAAKIMTIATVGYLGIKLFNYSRSGRKVEPFTPELGIMTEGMYKELKELDKEYGCLRPNWETPSLKPLRAKQNLVYSHYPASAVEKMMRLINDCRVKLSVVNSIKFSHGLFIHGNALLVNAHFIASIPDISQVILEFLPHSGRSHKLAPENIGNRSVKMFPNGYAIIYFRECRCPSLLKYVLGDVHEIKPDFEFEHLVGEASYRTNFTRLSEKEIITDVTNNVPLLLSKYVTPFSNPGDCGSPVLVHLPNGNVRICGIHEGKRSVTSEVACLLLTRDIADSMLDVTKIIYPLELESFSERTQKLLGDVPAESLCMHVAPGQVPINVLCGMPSDRNHRSESKVIETGMTFCKHLVPNYGGPEMKNKVIDGKWHNGHLISLGHASLSPRLLIPLDFIEDTVDICLEDIDFPGEYHPVPIIEACTGGIGQMNGINLNTAASVPFGGQKENLFDIASIVDFTIGPNSPLLLEIKHCLACYKAGISAGQIFRASLKDEVKKVGKPARQFFAGPTAFSVVCKMFLEPIFQALRTQPWFTSMEGMNCCSDKDVRKLLSKLLQKDMSVASLEEIELLLKGEFPEGAPEQIFFDGDYIKYDKVNYFGYIFVRAIIEKFIRQHPNYGTAILRGIISDLFFFLVVCEGTVYEITGQVPSGCLGVVIIQSLSEMFIKNMVHRICYTIHYNSLVTKSLFHFCGLVNYGDDNILNTTLGDHMSAQNISYAYNLLGIGITNADKTPGDLVSRPLGQIEFLKRVICVHPDLGVVMKLHLESIAKSLCYYLPGDETFSKRMISTCRGAQRELVLWSKDIYDEWSANISRDLLLLDISPDFLLSYEEMVTLAKSPDFVTW